MYSRLCAGRRPARAEARGEDSVLGVQVPEAHLGWAPRTRCCSGVRVRVTALPPALLLLWGQGQAGPRWLSAVQRGALSAEPRATSTVTVLVDGPGGLPRGRLWLQAGAGMAGEAPPSV